MVSAAWSSNPVRIQLSQGCDASSNLVQAICPHCGDRFGDDDVVTTAGLPVSPGNFTVCLTCRAIIRFDKRLQLRILEEDDWLDLSADKELLTAMLRWRMHILIDQLKEQKLGHSDDGIPGSR